MAAILPGARVRVSDDADDPTVRALRGKSGTVLAVDMLLKPPHALVQFTDGSAQFIPVEHLLVEKAVTDTT